MNGEDYALEFWHPTAREYGARIVGALDYVQRAAADAKARAWRIVRYALRRPAKPRYRIPAAPKDSQGAAEAAIDRYLAWAKARGLESVTLYSDSKMTGYAVMRAVAAGFAPRFVSVADFNGPAPAGEEE